MTQSSLILYHAPRTRSFAVRILLEELGVPYELKVINLRKGEQKKPEYLAINPMGKVPAIQHNGTVVTEQAAIFLYLADAFAEKGLAPALNDPLRGAYLRWSVFHSSCLEPAVMDKAMQRDSGKPSTVGYGTYEDTLNTFTSQLSKGPHMLGEKFYALDILWGSALKWLTAFNLIPQTPIVTQYIDRVMDRPSVEKVKAADSALSAELEAA